MNQVYTDCVRRQTVPDRIGYEIRLWRRRLGLWRRRAAERRELLRLGARGYSDIGIRADDARREAAKPFWRP
jgi:uncharacterized protein YjiS (DUF1127 family)